MRTADSCFFDRYVGIDYSGAKTPHQVFRACVFMSQTAILPSEVQPPPSPRKYWTRRGIAEWLVEHLLEARPTLVGIDHGFSFPVRFFDNTVCHTNGQHSSTISRNTGRRTTTFMSPLCVRESAEMQPRDGACELEARDRTACTSEVCLSLRRARNRGELNPCWHTMASIHPTTDIGVHFWPLDGWVILRGRSVIAEVYPSLWSRAFEKGERNDHQHDAFSNAEWMRRSDIDGTLAKFFTPNLELAEKKAADAEGWILGFA